MPSSHGPVDAPPLFLRQLLMVPCELLLYGIDEL